MLTALYRWLDNPDTCYLCLNFQTVAVLRLEAGRVAGTLNWQGRSFWFKAGSHRQGKRWVERWIAARGNDLPSKPVKPRRRSREKVVLQALISKRPAGASGRSEELRVFLRPLLECATHLVNHDLAVAPKPGDGPVHDLRKGHPEPIARTVTLEGLPQGGQLSVRYAPGAGDREFDCPGAGGQLRSGGG